MAKIPREHQENKENKNLNCDMGIPNPHKEFRKEMSSKVSRAELGSRRKNMTKAVRQEIGLLRYMIIIMPT